MPKVIFTVGLPGASKSTFAKSFCEKYTNYVRINRDDLRNSRGRYWLPKDEDLITAWEKEMTLIALHYGKNVIIDATNLDKNRRNDFIYFLQANCDEEIEVELKDFTDVPLEECIKRDLKRPNSVGEKVIRGMYNKYLNPIKPIKQNKKLPKAIIVDLDGTLCIHNGRSPFEYNKCDTDLINEPVEKILKSLLYDKDINIIYMSGREDYCRKKTIEWLKKHDLFFDWTGFCLYMRKSGDHRKDTIVKKELFDEHVKDKYCVEFVLDDRKCVSDMWRQLGLTCLQVDEGDF